MSTTEAYLDLHRHAPVAMLDHEITDRRAWTRETVRATDWTVTLGDAAITEILALAATLDRQPLPVLMLSPDQFAIAACRHAMARVRAILRDGIGVALVADSAGRLDPGAGHRRLLGLGQLSRRGGAEVGWDDDYDVTTRPPIRLRRRGSWTNVELSLHTDNAFGVAHPTTWASWLMPAHEGGISRFAPTPSTTRCSGATPVSSRASTGRSTTIAGRARRR